MTMVSGAAQRFQRSVNNTGPFNQFGYAVRLSESPAVCDSMGMVGLGRDTERQVQIEVFGAVDGGAPEVGMHTNARLWVGTPDCNRMGYQGANGFTFLDSSDNASVRLTRVDGRLEGTFIGALSSGAQISGQFAADYCNFYDFEMTGLMKCE